MSEHRQVQVLISSQGLSVLDVDEFLIFAIIHAGIILSSVLRFYAQRLLSCCGEHNTALFDSTLSSLFDSTPSPTLVLPYLAPFRVSPSALSVARLL